jgi:hypothetical protein
MKKANLLKITLDKKKRQISPKNLGIKKKDKPTQ